MRYGRTILWTMEDPPARLLFRGSLRRSGSGKAHSAWLVGLCCRCDVSCFCFRSTLQVLPQANCDLDQDNNTVLNLATLRRPSPCTLLVLPTPSLSQIQPVSRTDERSENDHLPYLHFTSSGVLNPSRLRSTTRQGTNPEGGEAGLFR